MKAKRFDANFDHGDDVTGSFDLSQARRPLQEQCRVNVDFPAWMIDSLDREAGRMGVARESMIKVWLAERLEQIASTKKFQWTAATPQADRNGNSIGPVTLVVGQHGDS